MSGCRLRNMLAWLEGEGIAGTSVDRRLLALDVRALDPVAIHLLSLCFEEAGLDDAARDELVMRHKRGLDPAMASGQQRLFTANQAGMSDVLLAREEGRWAELADLP